MPRILVVDDDPDILESLELALGSHYDVVTAPDGREALEVIAREGSAIDLVVLDLMMPRMSGGELIVELRARALRLPIIIASAAHDVRHRAAELAAQDFVAKPFSLRQLREKIASVLSSWGGGAPPGGSSPPTGAPPTGAASMGGGPQKARERPCSTRSETRLRAVPDPRAASTHRR